MERRIIERKKYVTKALLRKINEAAIREKRNKSWPDETIDRLPDRVLIKIIDQSYKRDEVRIRLDLEGMAYIDLSQLRFDTLPIVISYDDGTIEFEKGEAELPYGDGRDWKESVTRKPLRDEKFRMNVLKAYGNQCAVCRVKEPTSLRGAHIVDVAKRGRDDITNGICLCGTHEPAFDRGVLIINEDYKVTVSNPEELPGVLKKVRLPADKKDWPSKERLREKQRRLRERGL